MSDWYTEEHRGMTRLGLRVEERLHDETTPYQRIEIYRTPFFGNLMTLDGLVMFTERDEFVYHEMLVHVPLCAHPDPKQVLVIGGGDCGCVREALRHPGVERVVQCEIDQRVTELSREYFEWPAATLQDPRAEFLFADGVRYIEEHADSFDVIIIDSTDPIGPAVGLFTPDFYRATRRALRSGGICTAQTESPHWDPRLVGDIQAAMREAFQYVDLYLGHIPTYPSGTWSWSFASQDRRWDEPFDRERADRIAADSRYYNAELHRAAFALPNFVREAVEGGDPFARFER